MATAPQEVDGGRIPCPGCGGSLRFAAGKDKLECPSCGTTQAIELHLREGAQDGELDLEASLDELESKVPVAMESVVACQACGARTAFDQKMQAKPCPFCGTPLTSPPKQETVLQPRWILPFALPQKEVKQKLSAWLKGLWFAPGSFLEQAKPESAQGIYIPWFTFDAQTRSRYLGERGIERRRTRRNDKDEEEVETWTEWYPVSGQVDIFFDDLLVAASRSLDRKLLAKLTHWDLGHLVAWDEKLLAGFRSELPSRTLREGEAEARQRMESEIREAVRRDIGGDDQRVLQVDTGYSDRTFKLCLFPIWATSVRYQNKSWQVLVDARTGQVVGERPWSVFKIALAVLPVVAFLVWLLMYHGDVVLYFLGSMLGHGHVRFHH